MRIHCDAQVITSNEFGRVSTGKVHLWRIISVRRVTNIPDPFFARIHDLSTLHPELSMRKGGSENLHAFSYG
jgi:hypothetical protein